ncbi:DUF2796 domain-containing protein [Nitrincola alkalisediminis]|uniref:DUF2796 domain-containing protein n=1 Tax=Nitrincola alkalisediminis TaxID=1366656 RepID=UPI001873B4F9|nr:DUF2796 domain-containing protein [Nitrincola alkalisediminis]
MKRPFIQSSLLVTGLSMSWFALAHQSHSHSAHPDHDHAALHAHVHGEATLDVVFEGNMLLASLEAPAADIVGFEHLATDSESQAKVRNAEAQLKLAETLWALPSAAACELKDVSVNHELLATSDHDHDHKHDHHKHHDHTHGADHKHDHDHDHDHDQSQHSDIQVEYNFFCEHPEHLQAVSIQLFTSFPSLHNISVQMITPQGQKGLTLSPTQPRLTFNE